MILRHIITRLKKYFFCNTFTAGGAAIFQAPAYKEIGTGTIRFSSGRRIKEGGAAYLGNKLRELFDFQKFEQNADLQSVIDAVHARYSSTARMLTDDEADWVAAAGMPDTDRKQKNPFKKDDDNS